MTAIDPLPTLGVSERPNLPRCLSASVSRHFRSGHIRREAFRRVSSGAIVGAPPAATAASSICVVRTRAIAWIAVDRFLNDLLPDLGVRQSRECGLRLERQGKRGQTRSYFHRALPKDAIRRNWYSKNLAIGPCKRCGGPKQTLGVRRSVRTRSRSER